MGVRRRPRAPLLLASAAARRPPRDAQRAVVQVPWAASMRAGALHLMGTDDIGQRAVDFMSATLKPRWVASYSSELNLFMDLCAMEGVSSLRADMSFILRYYVRWAANLVAGGLVPCNPTCPRTIQNLPRPPRGAHHPWPAGRSGRHRLEAGPSGWTPARRTPAWLPFLADVALLCVLRRAQILRGSSHDCDQYVFRAFLATAAGMFLFRKQTRASKTNHAGNNALDYRAITCFHLESKTQSPADELVPALQNSRSAPREIADLVHAFVFCRATCCPHLRTSSSYPVTRHPGSLAPHTVSWWVISPAKP